MDKKILLAGWDNFSPKKQELVREWVKSILYAQSVSKALIELCTCDDVTDESAVMLKQKLSNQEADNENFEEMLEAVEQPSDFPEMIKNIVCLIACESISNPQQKEQCKNNCNKQ